MVLPAFQPYRTYRTITFCHRKHYTAQIIILNCATYSFRNCVIKAKCILLNLCPYIILVVSSQVTLRCCIRKLSLPVYRVNRFSCFRLTRSFNFLNYFGRFMASKSYYFGVGGSIKQFEEFLDKLNRFHWKMAWKNTDGYYDF